MHIIGQTNQERLSMTQSNDFHLYLKKASEDILLLTKLYKDQEIADSIWGFHAQQALEKMMKAYLSKISIPFPKSHDLVFLFDLIPVEHNHHFLLVSDECDELTPFAVATRYDDFIDHPLDREKILTKINTIFQKISQ